MYSSYLAYKRKWSGCNGKQILEGTGRVPWGTEKLVTSLAPSVWEMEDFYESSQFQLQDSVTRAFDRVISLFCSHPSFSLETLFWIWTFSFAGAWNLTELLQEHASQIYNDEITSGFDCTLLIVKYMELLLEYLLLPWVCVPLKQKLFKLVRVR
jgi:hypothetical protein